MGVTQGDSRPSHCKCAPNFWELRHKRAAEALRAKRLAYHDAQRAPTYVI